MSNEGFVLQNQKDNKMLRKLSLFWFVTVVFILVVSQPLVAAYQEGDTVADFTVKIYNTSTDVSLYDYAGHIIVLDFFAHWCGPCGIAASEMEPYIQQYYHDLGGNPASIPVTMISINIDGSNLVATNAYIATYGLETVWDDFSRVAYNAFSQGYIPHIAIINGAAGTNYDQWEILYTQYGYVAGRYITFRSIIDAVQGVSGSLQVTLTPPEAASAGAQWNVDGGSWLSSGAVAGNLSVGVHTVNYKTIDGVWMTPPSEQVTIATGQTTQLNRTYRKVADINGDDRVNMLDFVSLADKWRFAGSCQEDFDCNGIVYVGDLLLLAENWLVDYTIPEPLNVTLDIDNSWMYQNLPAQTASNLTATVLDIDDPAGNSSYTYDWEFILPDDVTIESLTIGRGQAADTYWNFAAPDTNEPNGLSDSGQAITVKVTVTGDNYGNTGTAEAHFGIALLGDVNNDTVVDIADRSIINAFWRNGSAGSFTLRDCNVNCDDLIDVADRSITNAIWRGILGQNSVSSPCPFRQVAPDMVYIPGGEFEMGDHFAPEGYSDELPVHAVLVDAVYMGRYEITNQQYCDYLNSAYPVQLNVVDGIVYASSDSSYSYPYCDTHSYDTGSQINFSDPNFSVSTKDGRDMSDDPMVMVSWYGAVAYCNWRSGEEGKESCYNLSTWDCDFTKKGYRLATEAEWEYAARGGLSGKRFPWGDTISHSQANYNAAPGGYDVSPTSGYHPLWNGDDPDTSPVGFFDGTLKYKVDYNWPGSATSYQTTSGANGYGLYDMAGNVFEWCNDWYDSDYYDTSPYDNPTGPASGSYRVVRGGCWDYDARYCRVAAYRIYGTPDSRGSALGFRIVLDLE